MLYLSFRVIIFFTSVIGLITMLGNEDYTYIFFPIITTFWTLYTFFDEEDTEHRRRNGEYYEIDSSHHSDLDRGWLSDFNDYEPITFTSYGSPYCGGRTGEKDNKQEYKKIVKRCKRTLKVSIAKDSKEDGDKTT